MTFELNPRLIYNRKLLALFYEFPHKFSGWLVGSHAIF